MEYGVWNIEYRIWSMGGVVECWSDGIMKIFLNSNIPIFHHSTTPIFHSNWFDTKKLKR